jgi:formate hydrogenlyase subunit 3/multisubunit Na+/H+ antiporter MnhD subunit
MRVAGTIAATLLSGFGAFAFMRWVPSMVENRTAPFSALLGRRWWLVGVYAVTTVTVFWVGRPTRRRPALLPVASRLTVRSRVG